MVKKYENNVGVKHKNSKNNMWKIGKKGSDIYSIQIRRRYTEFRCSTFFLFSSLFLLSFFSLPCLQVLETDLVTMFVVSPAPALPTTQHCLLLPGFQSRLPQALATISVVPVSLHPVPSCCLDRIQAEYSSTNRSSSYSSFPFHSTETSSTIVFLYLFPTLAGNEPKARNVPSFFPSYFHHQTSSIAIWVSKLPDPPVAFVSTPSSNPLGHVFHPSCSNAQPSWAYLPIFIYHGTPADQVWPD